MRLRLARTRLAVSGLAGVAAATVAATLLPWQVAVLVGWCTTAALLVGWVLLAVLPRDGATTAAMATREDNSRFVTDLLLVVASVASLVGVGLALVKAGNQTGAAEAATTAVAVLSVVLSWAVVHVVYLLRYAHLYYSERGGIDFPGQDEPDYRDFAYFAFTIGMTYQVSDTAVRSKSMRRAILGHALLSYLYGTAIVAMTINIVAGLVR